MTDPSRLPRSQRSRSTTAIPLENPDLTYTETPLLPTSGPTTTSFQLAYDKSEPQYPPEDFEASGQPITFLQPSYQPSPRAPHPSILSVEATPQDSELFQQQDLYYPSQVHPDASMMSQRDIGYGYMPGPIPSYSSAGQPYNPALAPLPGYYPDAQTHRNLSGLSRPNLLHSTATHAFISGERESALRRRQQRYSQEGRRQAKLRARKVRAPGLVDVNLDENSVSSGIIDVFAAAPSTSSAYVSDPISYSRAPMSSPPRDDYRTMHSGPSYNAGHPYQPNYTMSTMNPSTLAPPILPNNVNQSYAGRSSPLLQTPLPPGPQISHNLEPVVLNQREKPQCWDHGCNGREFSTFSNLLRHQREKSGSAAKSYCPHCGAEFTRTTARNGHMEHGKCKSRRPSNTAISTTTQ